MMLAATILLILVSVVLTVVVLMQEGKSTGLGSLNGTTDTYWSNNKGRSAEGKLELFTRILAILFFVLSALLTLNILK